MPTFHVFHRTWWTPNSKWPQGREPGAGEKFTIERNVDSEKEARAICKAWNSENDPGPLSDKAEYEEE